MQYMGGKAKIARALVAAILADTPLRERWFEPFVGGGSVLQAAGAHFAEVDAADAHPDLIAMWSAVMTGWMPPSEVSRALYEDLRTAETSALRGFVGFGCSFGGKWFGGYAGEHRRTFSGGASYGIVESAARSVGRKGAAFVACQARFLLGSYADFEPPGGTVVYCDPPYVGTTGYHTGLFDHDAYYRRLAGWAGRGCAVYSSEYAAPSVPHRLVWEREKRAILERGNNSRTVVERLYQIK